MYFQKRGIPSMQSGPVVGQGSPCERQRDQPRILLRSQSCQEGVERRTVHVLQFGDKEIEVWCGTRRGFSMWEEGIVGTRGEIVPEQFQKDHVVGASFQEG